MRRSLTPLVGVLLLLVQALQPAVAQEPEPKEPIVAPRPALKSERLIYLPYKDFEAILNKETGSVVVPLDEFLKLQEQARTAKTGEQPVPAVISRAEYSATVEENFARIRATYTVRVLGNPWVTVPLTLGGVAIGEVTTKNDGTVLLKGTGNGQYSLLFSERGEQKVTIELIARIRTSPDGQTFEFTVPPVGVTLLDVTVPKANQTIDITPELVRLPVEAAADGEQVPDRTRARVSLGSTNKIVVGWRPEASLRPQMDLLAGVTSLTKVSIREGLIYTHAHLDYQVLRGTLDRMQVAVPKGHRILDVSSPSTRIKGWSRKGEDARDVITIELLRGTEGTIPIELRTERPLPEEDEPFSTLGLADKAAFGIHAVDVVRESGEIVVEHEAETAVTVAAQSGLVRVQPNEIDSRIRAAGALSFKFFSPSAELRLTAKPIEPEIATAQNGRFTFTDDRVNLVTTLNYNVARIGVFRVRVAWPKGWAFDSANSPVVRDDALENGVLTLTLDQQRQGAFAIQLQGHLAIDPDEATQTVSLPLPEPLDTVRETGTISVVLPDDREGIIDRDRLTGLFPLPNMTANRNGNLLAAWSYSRRPISLVVTTKRKPVRLSSSVATEVAIDRDRVRGTTQLRYQVENAGLDRFRFQVPELIADELFIEPAPGTGIRIKQRDRSEPVDEMVIFTVTLQERAEGTIPFQLTWDRPSPIAGFAEGDDQEPEAMLHIVPVRPLGLPEQNGAPGISLSSLTGELSILRDRSLSLATTDRSEELEPIDVRERKLSPQRGDDPEAVALAFRYFHQPVSVTLSVTEHEIQSVVETIVSESLIEIVVARDPVATYRARYLVTTSERQRLDLLLPAGATPLGVMVGDQTTVLEKNEQAGDREGAEPYFVSVARATTADEPFVLTLLFQVSLERSPFEGTGGVLDLRLPEVGGTGGVTQQQRVTVWLPDQYKLTRSPDRFDPVRETSPAGALFGTAERAKTEADARSSFGEPVSGRFDLPTEGHSAVTYTSLGAEPRIVLSWTETRFFTGVVSGAVVLVGLLLLAVSWQTRISLVLLTALVASLFALENHEFVVRLLEAARWGVWVVLGLWITQSIFRPRSVSERPAASTPGTASPTPPGTVVPPPGIFKKLT